MTKSCQCSLQENLRNQDVFQELGTSCRYLAQAKSWVSGELFEEGLFELDKKFHQERPKVVIIPDICPAHPHIENLKPMTVVFLPKNTISITQPMDQGVIRSLKAKYHTILLRYIIGALDKNKGIPKFNILEAMYMLKDSRTKYRLLQL